MQNANRSLSARVAICTGRVEAKVELELPRFEVLRVAICTGRVEAKLDVEDAFLQRLRLQSARGVWR